MKNKFKVGDIVRGTKESDGAYNITNSNMAKGEVVRVRDDGKIDIKIIENKNGAFVGSTFEVVPCFFEKVKPETIVIYRKDCKVIALDKSTGRKAIARCCPEDTFDFEIGAKLAFKRLFEQKIDDEPTYYSGKIIFTKGRGAFKTGHIYKIKDGYITDSDGSTYPLSAPFRNLEDVKDYFGGVENRKRERGFSSHRLELIEVVE